MTNMKKLMLIGEADRRGSLNLSMSNYLHIVRKGKDY